MPDQAADSVLCCCTVPAPSYTVGQGLSLPRGARDPQHPTLRCRGSCRRAGQSQIPPWQPRGPGPGSPEHPVCSSPSKVKSSTSQRAKRRVRNPNEGSAGEAGLPATRRTRGEQGEQGEQPWAQPMGRTWSRGTDTVSSLSLEPCSPSPPRLGPCPVTSPAPLGSRGAALASPPPAGRDPCSSALLGIRTNLSAKHLHASRN